MEGVGVRLGRSSTRYGPAAVFSGPVRKWKKTWAPLSSSHSSSSSNTNPTTKNNSSNNNSASSHLLLYKWTSISSPASPINEDTTATTQELPCRKFRYVPVSVIEEQKKEAAEQAYDEAKPSDDAATDPSAMASKDDDTDVKTIVNDIPKEEAQAPDKAVAAPAINETNLDLSLALKGHDDDHSTNKSESSHIERESSGGNVEMKPVSNSEPTNRAKRKSMGPDLEMRV